MKDIIITKEAAVAEFYSHIHVKKKKLSNEQVRTRTL